MLSINLLNKYTLDEYSSKIVLRDISRSKNASKEIEEIIKILNTENIIVKLSLIENKFLEIKEKMKDCSFEEKTSSVLFYNWAAPMFVFLSTLCEEGCIQAEVYSLIEKEAKNNDVTFNEIISKLSEKYKSDVTEYKAFILNLIKKYNISNPKLTKNESNARGELIALGLNETELNKLKELNPYSPFTITLLTINELKKQEKIKKEINVGKICSDAYGKLTGLHKLMHTVENEIMYNFSDKLKYKRKDLGFEYTF